MTTATVSLDHDVGPKWQHWWAAAVLVLTVHIGILGLYLSVRQVQAPGLQIDGPIVLVDLEPVITPPPPADEPPPQEIEEPARPEPPPPEPAVVATPEPPPEPKRVERKKPAPQQPVQRSSSPSPVPPSWRDTVVVKLQRAKRYPASAASRREEGSVTLGVRIDRRGALVSHRIIRGSGNSAFDEEALAIAQRAQPFPPFPGEMTQAYVDLVVPLRFSLR